MQAVPQSDIAVTRVLGLYFHRQRFFSRENLYSSPSVQEMRCLDLHVQIFNIILIWESSSPIPSPWSTALQLAATHRSAHVQTSIFFTSVIVLLGICIALNVQLKGLAKRGSLSLGPVRTLTLTMVNCIVLKQMSSCMRH